jgi:hypothetical protein
MANPLLGTNPALKVKQIEQSMQLFKAKIRALEEFHRQVGTDKDNHKFRQKIELAVKDATTIMKNCGT